MPTLLVNENFPVPALKLLRAQGVQAEAVQELMPGAPDTTVLAYAVAHGHWLVTFDRDYGELVFARGEPSPAVIVYVRQQPVPPTRPAELLLSLLSAPRPTTYVVRPPRGCRKVAEPHFLESRSDEVDGHFVTVSEQSVRLRRLPTPR